MPRSRLSSSSFWTTASASTTREVNNAPAWSPKGVAPTHTHSSRCHGEHTLESNRSRLQSKRSTTSWHLNLSWTTHLCPPTFSMTSPRRPRPFLSTKGTSSRSFLEGTCRMKTATQEDDQEDKLEWVTTLTEQEWIISEDEDQTHAIPEVLQLGACLLYTSPSPRDA